MKKLVLLGAILLAGCGAEEPPLACTEANIRLVLYGRDISKMEPTLENLIELEKNMASPEEMERRLGESCREKWGQ